MARRTTSSKSPKFEDAVEQLETIIDRIESGEVGLEQCLAEYEKGMKLIQQCRTILTAAEKKIAELAPDEKGRLEVQESDVE